VAAPNNHRIDYFNNRQQQKPVRFVKGKRSGRQPSSKKADIYMEEIAESILSDIEREDEAYESHMMNSQIYNNESKSQHNNNKKPLRNNITVS